MKSMAERETQQKHQRNGVSGFRRENNIALLGIVLMSLRILHFISNCVTARFVHLTANPVRPERTCKSSSGHSSSLA